MERDFDMVIKNLYLLLIPQALDVLGFLNFSSTLYRRFCELLSASQLTHGTGFVKLTFETL